MSEILQPVRGMKDLIGNDYLIFNHIIDVAQKIGDLYGYKGFSTPIVEYSGVFNRTLGDSSDIVSKEMYNFPDRNGKSLSLRPEFTAGIVRALISNKLYQQLPLKLFSHGPIFRYERPQAGRQRQFHQLNFEYFGANGAYADAETIKLGTDILRTLNLEAKLSINSIGCKISKENYKTKLIEYFNDFKDQLSEDSLRRLEKNPLRILDSKDENDQKLIDRAPLMADSYTEFSRDYFAQVLSYLDNLKVKYCVDNTIVRGLDYYCHTTFEFTTELIGAQAAILAGGRYDYLVSMMNGPEVNAVGFAAGIERLALIGDYKLSVNRPIYIVPIESSNIFEAMKLADILRQKNFKTVISTEGKTAKRLQNAIDDRAKFAIFIGDEEISNSKFKLKNLDNRSESVFNINELIAKIQQ